MSILRDAKNTFRFGNMVNRLILVNVVVFLIMLVFIIIAGAGRNNGPLETVFSWLAMPYDWHLLIYRPHTILTNIFLHIEPMHLFWNMIGLYWFGTIFGDLAGDRRILPLYIYSGIFGSLLSLGAAYAFPHLFAGAITLNGASGAVMAMLFAAATTSPDYKLNLLLFGRVSIKYIALFYAVIDLSGFAGALNSGGHVAHIGGALFGWFFVYQLRRGRDLGRGLNRVISYFSNPKPKAQSPVKVTYRRQNATNNGDFQSLSPTERQRRIDEILDKISKSGYNSLTKEEKEILFKASKD